MASYVVQEPEFLILAPNVSSTCRQYRVCGLRQARMVSNQLRSRFSVRLKAPNRVISKLRPRGGIVAASEQLPFSD